MLLAVPFAVCARGAVLVTNPGWDARKWPLIGLATALWAVLGHAPVGWSMLAAAVLFVAGVWRLATTPRPAPRWRPRAAAAGGLALVAALLAFATTTYAALHPLDATFAGSGDDVWSFVAGDRRGRSGWRWRTGPTRRSSASRCASRRSA